MYNFRIKDHIVVLIFFFDTNNYLFDLTHYFELI